MNFRRNYILFFFSLLACNILNAQLEVAHLNTKGFSSTGFGGFLNIAVPVTEGNSITTEAGFYLFKKNDDNIAIVPLLLGYRCTLDGTGSGLYVEPTVGYTLGGSDIQKYNESGSLVIDESGNIMDQKVKGPTAGIAGGYIFPGRIAINIGLRYQHIFVSGDPSLNMFSLRLSHAITFGRREY